MILYGNSCTWWTPICISYTKWTITAWLPLKKRRTLEWSHTLKLRKQHYRTDLGKFFFSERVVSQWNLLDADAVSSATVNSFKNHLQRIRGQRETFSQTRSVPQASRPHHWWILFLLLVWSHQVRILCRSPVYKLEIQMELALLVQSAPVDMTTKIYVPSVFLIHFIIFLLVYWSLTVELNVVIVAELSLSTSHWLSTHRFIEQLWLRWIFVGMFEALSCWPPGCRGLSLWPTAAYKWTLQEVLLIPLYKLLIELDCRDDGLRSIWLRFIAMDCSNHECVLSTSVSFDCGSCWTQAALIGDLVTSLLDLDVEILTTLCNYDLTSNLDRQLQTRHHYASASAFWLVVWHKSVASEQFKVWSAQ